MIGSGGVGGLRFGDLERRRAVLPSPTAFSIHVFLDSSIFSDYLSSLVAVYSIRSLLIDSDLLYYYIKFESIKREK
jgi:hypothetical protein